MLKYASLVAQTGKNLPAMWETPIRSLDWEDPLEKGKVAHSSIPAWTIPWTEEPGRLQFMGSQSRTQLSNYHYTHFRVKSFLQICGNPYFLIIKMKRLPSWLEMPSVGMRLVCLRHHSGVIQLCHLLGNLYISVSLGISFVTNEILRGIFSKLLSRESSLDTDISGYKEPGKGAFDVYVAT